LYGTRGGGANSSLHPSFRIKGGAPAPLHPPPGYRPARSINFFHIIQYSFPPHYYSETLNKEYIGRIYQMLS